MQISMEYIKFYNARANSTGDLSILANSILVPSEDDNSIVNDSTDSVLVPEMKKSRSANLSNMINKSLDRCEVLPVSLVVNEDTIPSQTRLVIRVMEAGKPDYIFHLIKQYNKHLKFIETTPNEYNIGSSSIVLRGFGLLKDSRWTYIHYADNQMRCTLKPQLRNAEFLYLNEFTSPYVAVNFNNVTSFNGMFSAMNELESITIEQFDTKHIVSMEEMFLDCINLKSITITGCDFSAVQTMANFCRGCKSLKSIRFFDCKFNILCDYWNAFYDCPSLETLIVPEEIKFIIIDATDDISLKY